MIGVTEVGNDKGAVYIVRGRQVSESLDIRM